MTEKKRRINSNMIVLLIVAFFSINFVAFMGFLNYRTSAIDLEDMVISRLEAESASGIETAIGFGKSFDNYYGMDEVFDHFSDQYAGPQPFVLSADGELLYYAGDSDEDILSFMDSRQFANGFRKLDDNNGGSIVSGTSALSSSTS